MKAIVVGCGRVGSKVAKKLAKSKKGKDKTSTSDLGLECRPRPTKKKPANKIRNADGTPTLDNPSITLATPGLGEIMRPAENSFDQWDPANISPLVAYLSSGDCAFNGETFLVQGGNVTIIESWSRGARVDRDSKWTVPELAEALAPHARTSHRPWPGIPRRARPADTS